MPHVRSRSTTIALHGAGAAAAALACLALVVGCPSRSPTRDPGRQAPEQTDRHESERHESAAEIEAAIPVPGAVGRADGLDVVWRGGNDRRGGGDGPVLVLFHGFGAPGDDLVPLAEALSLPTGVRIALPAAPLSLDARGHARAWWPLDRDRFAAGPRDLGADRPRGLVAARAAVLAWLAELDVAPERLALGGFSQGAMLACDIALRYPSDVAAVIALSGAPVTELEWREEMRRHASVRFFLSHGRQDPLLSFDAATRLRATLVDAQVEVTWVPFDGGHTIPPEVVAALEAFVRRVWR